MCSKAFGDMPPNSLRNPNVGPIMKKKVLRHVPYFTTLGGYKGMLEFWHGMRINS